MIFVPHRYLFWLGFVFSLLGCTIDQNRNQSDSTSEEFVQRDTNTQAISDSTYNSTDTADKIAAIQDRLNPIESPDAETSEVNLYRLDVAPYHTFLNTDGFLDLNGRTMNEIDEALGDAPIVVKQSIKGAPIRKEIRIYMPYQDDSTGLYIFFENEMVIEFKMDEFNGIIQSGILDYFQ